MSETMTARTCRYPGCDRPAQPGEPGAGRPPEYCDNPDHNRASAWRARQRRDNGAVADESRPVDAARERASIITAQVTGMTEHLIAQLQQLLGELQTVADPGAAEAQIEAVASDAAEQIAAANARAVRAEQAQRKAMSDAEEADAAATEATARVHDLDAALTQARADLAETRGENEQLRVAQEALMADFGQARSDYEASERENRRLAGDLTQARQDLQVAQQQAVTAQAGRDEAVQRAAADRRNAEAETARAAAAEQATTQVRQQLDHTRAELDEVRDRAVELRENLATLAAERDAARVEVERERAHGDQRVKDLHESYARQIADLRASATLPTSSAPRPRTKRPSGDPKS